MESPVSKESGRNFPSQVGAQGNHSFHERGILTMRHVMDEVRYENDGTEVLLAQAKDAVMQQVFFRSAGDVRRMTGYSMARCENSWVAETEASRNYGRRSISKA